MTATLLTGVAVTFATGFLAEITSLNWTGFGERAVVETSHAGTSNWRTFQAGSLRDPGSLDVGLWFIPGTSPPSGDVAETVTVTWPDSGAATWAAEGFMFNLDGIGAGAIEENMEASASIKLSGAVTITP